MPLVLSGLISTSCARHGLAAEKTTSANSRTAERRGFMAEWLWVALRQMARLSRLPEGAPVSGGRAFRNRIREIERVADKGVGRNRRPGAQIGGGLNNIPHLRLALELNHKLASWLRDRRKAGQAPGCGRE